MAALLQAQCSECAEWSFVRDKNITSTQCEHCDHKIRASDPAPIRYVKLFPGKVYRKQKADNGS